MKLPWIKVPVLGLPLMSSCGTDTPTSKPLMISPRSSECDASITKPVVPGSAPVDLLHR